MIRGGKCMDNFENYESIVKIKVIGVGGAGNNAVNRMITDNIMGAEFYVLNTDAQVLNCSKAEHRIMIGKNTTKGLGAGANPEIGLKAALESEDEIRAIVKDTDMVFVAAGMGGGTGTGAAPVVCRLAKECGALVIGIVTRPFSFEGKNRMNNALSGIEELKKYVDSLIVISNDHILHQNSDLPLKDSFLQADEILKKSVQSITELVTLPAHINLDFADVKTLLTNKGTAMIGFGIGKGTNRAQYAAANAISSPLLETSIKGARNAIVAITSSKDATLLDFTVAVEHIRDASGEDINIIFGASINENLEDEVQVTVIATDFNEDVVNHEVQPLDVTIVRKPVPYETTKENENKQVYENDELDENKDSEDTQTLKPSFF